MSILKGLTTAQKWVIGLIGITVALAVGNLGRAIVALRYASSLPELSTSVPLAYFAATGGLWGIVFIFCTVGLSRFQDWGRWSTLIAVTLYQAHVWVNRVLFDVSTYARRATPRNLVLTAILLFVFWGLLSLPSVRKVFDGHEEQA